MQFLECFKKTSFKILVAALSGFPVTRKTELGNVTLIALFHYSY